MKQNQNIGVFSIPVLVAVPGYFAGFCACTILYFCQCNGTTAGMIGICMIIMFGKGFRALFVTIAAEQYGANLRATATTTTPNMVRGLFVLIAFLFEYLQQRTGFVVSVAITGFIVPVIGCFALIKTKETFGKDLNFLEM